MTLACFFVQTVRPSAQLSVRRNENSRSSEGQLKFLVYTLELASCLAEEHGMQKLGNLCPLQHAAKGP